MSPSGCGAAPLATVVGLVSAAGFDDDGVLALRCGEDAKDYEARLNDDLTVALRNPSGKDVSALPAGDDDATKAAKKQLSATKKELKQIAEMQAARLYEALCAERSWTSADWLNPKLSSHGRPVWACPGPTTPPAMQMWDMSAVT